jgi:hypothetical protein
VGYDSFGTTSEPAGDWRGKELRKVLINPGFVGFHEGRYGSGLHGCWAADPRIEERELKERSARWRADDERRAAARAAGLEWLTSVTDAELEALKSEDVEAHGIGSADLRAELERRRSARADAERRATWERCRALVPDGAILVDDGSPPVRGSWGGTVMPGREPHVYYNVRVWEHWQKDADLAGVTTESRESVGTLAMVAEWLASGRLRIVAADDVPPAPVTARIGHAVYRDIRRVQVGDRVVWVGRARFASEFLVLDERGRIVRSKAVRAAAVQEVLTA